MDIAAIAKHFEKKEGMLSDWFQHRTKGIRLPVTASVDIRNAGFKITVVDTNVFPAGFNNLCNSFSKTAAGQFKKYFEKAAPGAKKIVIVPEAFTRNIPYFQNIVALQKLLGLAGFEVAIGFLGEELPSDPFTAELPEGQTLKLEKLKRNKEKVFLASMEPDALLLNNDCSNGIPEILSGTRQPIFPSPDLGWHARSKKHHFEIYCQLIEEMARVLEIDCWRFCPITRHVRKMDLSNPSDLERLAETSEEVLKEIQEKYKKYGIAEAPYVFIKSVSGTFGLGLTHVSSKEEILNFNRKERQKLTGSKGGVIPSEYLVQEGVPTIDSFEKAPIEPVLYMVGGESVGGFFRIHEKKDAKGSLNAPGSRFESLCFHKLDEKIEAQIDLHCEDHHDFFKIARWLGKIAALAVGLEEQDLQSA